MSLTAGAAPARLQPYLGDAFRRSWPNDAARLTYRREAVAALGPAYAAPGRFWQGLGAWAAGAVGCGMLGTGIAGLITSGMSAVVGIVTLLVGLVLGALGLVIGIRVIGGGSQLARALQGWLAVGSEDPHPTLTALLGGVGITRVALGVLQLLGAIGAVVRGLGALGGPDGVATALPLLVGSLASWVTGVAVVCGLVRLVRGRAGAMPAAVPTGGLAPGASPYDGWSGASPSADDVARWPTGAPIARVARGTEPDEAAPAAPAVAPDGIVTSVPGFAPSNPPVAPSVPPAPAPSVLPAATPSVPPVAPSVPPAVPTPQPPVAAQHEDVEATRLSTPARPAPQVRVALSDGTVLAPGRTLVGRSPEAREGEDVDAFAAVADRSVSKTHLLVEIADGVVTVTDRASTNGTSLETAGGQRRCAPWVPQVVGLGMRVRFGNLVLEVSDAGAAS